MSLSLRPITYSDETFAPILAEAEQAGGAFMLRVRDEWLSGIQRFGGEGEFLLGAFLGSGMVGVGGVSQDPYQPQPGLGRVRHIYVLERVRRQGVARLLMAELIDRARANFAILRLRTRNPAAASLYESIGFIRSHLDNETHRFLLRA